MGSRRGYAISVDFMLAAMVFFVVLAYSVSTYAYYLERYDDAEAGKNLEISTLAASDVLLKSAGSPQDWELDPDSAQSIGLVGKPNVIDAEKLSAFLEMDYNRSRELLGLGNDYYFNVAALNWTKIMEKGGEQEGSSVVVRRVALYNGSYVRVTLGVYR